MNQDNDATQGLPRRSPNLVLFSPSNLVMIIGCDIIFMSWLSQTYHSTLLLYPGLGPAVSLLPGGVMPISEYDSQIFAARATADDEETTTSSSSSSTLCAQVFCTAIFYSKKHKQQRVSLNLDLCSNIFTCQYIKKAINIKKFTAAEINKATGNYSKQNIIGEGGQGTVYKGLLLPSNQQIAVKRVYKKGSTNINEQFVNEIILLSQINNKNVVKLLGCCFETEMPSIVYEYISNSSLDHHLFDIPKQCGLPWNHRLRIAVQVAQVLEYLHTTIRVPIIHRDIKSSNILLDDNFMVKVSDFGLSKLLGYQNEFNTFVEDTNLSDCFETLVMGTLGYADPEYIQDGLLSKNSDVYGFGVVLAELLTTQRALIRNSKAEDRYLAPRFLEKLKDDRLEEILDGQLVNEGSMEQLEKVAHLAGRCLEFKRNDRPTMRQVLRELQDISGV